MSMKAALISLGLGGLAVFTAFYPQTDPKVKETVILNTILKVQEYAHFENNEINDEFSQDVFDKYMERLDYGKRFLLQEDADQLAVFRTQIDDMIKAEDLSFFENSVARLEVGIERVRDWYPEILAEPFDFSTDEMFETDGEKREYATTIEEQRALWEKALKYETLVKLNRKIKKQEEQVEEGAEEEVKTVEELEEEARESVKDTYDDWFKRLDKVKRSDRFETYVNSITHAFDPHTDYYNPKEKEDFDINMSGRLEGIGARLQTDGDLTKVVDIIPGGPAWKQKQLEVGDMISRVLQGDQIDPEDITGMRIDDVVKRIRGKKGTIVTLTVVKKDGSEKDITITRDEVIIDEGFAKSLIIEHAAIEGKIGYIYLPRFYSNFNSKDGPKASKDVDKEINKLKDAGVDGIILDIRNNGGGALNEVVDMAGLFIEEGPIVQVKNRRGDPYIHTDKNANVSYDGPLVVMVNSNSASASEILSAALQDYKRAVVIGSPTFGKGTVQRFFDLDRAVSGASDIKPLGQVKITTQKYYRVDGGSVQLRGVEPDIILPDNYMFIETGEKDYDHAMEWSRIDPVAFDQDVNVVESISSLRAASEERVQSHDGFSMVIENARRIEKMQKQTAFPLSLDDYQAYMEQRKQQSEKFEDMFEPIESFSLTNPSVDEEYIAMDSSRVARNDRWLENLQKDIYLEEALLVMSDLTEKRP